MLILSTWEAAYRLVGWRDWIFPAPTHVLDATLNLVNVRTKFGDPVTAAWPHAVESEPDAGGAMERHTLPYFPDRWPATILGSRLVTGHLVSGGRLLLGFVLSIGLGTIVGLVMWRFDAVDRFLGPLFLGLQTLPSVCWVPLAILAMGINEWGILFVLVMGSFFAIAISLRDGLRTVPPIFRNAGMMLGARSWKLYWYVLLPAGLPAAASSLRSGFSFAWRSLMGAELVFEAARHHGLGYLLHEGRVAVDVGQVIAVMAMMVGIGMAADRFVFKAVERKIHARFGLMTAR